MKSSQDLTGQRFGRLLVKRLAGVDKSRDTRWECICDCGNTLTVTSSHLMLGHTKSCGCFRVEVSRKWGESRKGISVNFVHGHSSSSRGSPRGSRTYSAWKAMRERCSNPKHQKYGYYGGRGISVCERWDSFVNFLFDMGECPPGLTIERVNNGGNYEPSNCKWATRSEQIRNQRRPEKKRDARGRWC
jgi:hypothetical protein